ncbi:MAG: DUF4386 domain-containing protein [Bacteroidota bacterium]
MKNTKQLGRTIGLLMLGIILVGIPSTLFRGISTSLAKNPDFLTIVFEKSQEMRLTILFDMIASGLWLVVGGMMLKHIKTYSKPIAYIFLGLLTVFLATIVFGDISHLSLISLAEHNSLSETLNNNLFNALGLIKVKDYIWSHLLSLILYSSANFLLLWFLFKSKMVPRFLAVWGILAMTIVFTASWLQIFGISVSMYAYYQNGINFIFFISWVTIKGFSENSLLPNTA